ncbi:tripartite motif-containing protein 75-like [Acinonyx jubatus]|uniref:Tripartite motif-containing protein 75-like n=1 Tax=Acinonyx jubatus TaxID=32536 RepID=A0A6I9ZDQ1_ACIJB|nr:tripartite motif-containing protein 75-like [Acinonyx jubatus]
MAFAASLAELHAEASCPLCLDYLRDPVTIACGHNFCLQCIQQCWEHLQHILPCPVCLHHCPDRNFRRNTQLCHVTGFVRQLPGARGKRKLQDERPLCEKHNQVLALFCEKDLELLCPQCKASSDHQDHPLTPIEQAAARHRKKLKSYIEPLKKQVEDAEKGLKMQVSKLFQLRRKVENRRYKLHSEFEQFRHFLGKEQGAIHIRLLIEENRVQEKVIEGKNQMSDYHSTLRSLLSAITEKCLQTDLDLLTGIESIHNMYEHLETPAAFSYKLRKEICSLPPQYFGLQKMISTFQVDLTLDPETAHHNLLISQDRKTATFQKMKPSGARNPQTFTSYPAVLSCEGFDAGRHFWQVEIRGLGEWSLGVCKESFPRRALIAPVPNNGCWQIQFWTSTDGTEDSVNLKHIGIFLDYELGEISFYNLSNNSHLYTFSEFFSEKLMPYFSVGPSSKSLTISLVKDES